MEGFAVTCPLAPDASRLISGFCSSSRAFGLGFLQTPPHGDALALLLAFGSAITWHEDFHLARSVPCLAHTFPITRRAAVGVDRAVSRHARAHRVTDGRPERPVQARLDAAPEGEWCGLAKAALVA